MIQLAMGQFLQQDGVTKKIDDLTTSFKKNESMSHFKNRGKGHPTCHTTFGGDVCESLAIAIAKII